MVSIMNILKQLKSYPVQQKEYRNLDRNSRYDVSFGCLHHKEALNTYINISKRSLIITIHKCITDVQSQIVTYEYSASGAVYSVKYSVDIEDCHSM